MNCVVYMDLRPFQCAQFLGWLKKVKAEKFSVEDDIGTWTRRLKFVAILNAALGLIQIQSRYLMNCVVYVDPRPFHCAQCLGGLKLLKLGNFLLKMISGRPKISVAKAYIAAVKIVVKQDA